MTRHSPLSSMNTSTDSTAPDDERPQSRFSFSTTNDDTRSSRYTENSSLYGQLESDPPLEADFQNQDSDDWVNYVQAEIKEHESDNIPSDDQLEKAGEIPIYDANGNTRLFRTLYSGTGLAEQRQLIVFIRFFYCTSCQSYIRALTNALPPRLSPDSPQASVPMSTSITIIGCGQSSLISTYINRTKCPYPVYADPKLKLFKSLGCRRWGGIKFGKQPEYNFGKSMTETAFATMYDQLKANVRAGDFAIPAPEEASFIDSAMISPSDKSKKPIPRRLAPGIASTTIPEDDVLPATRRISEMPTTALPDMPPRPPPAPTAPPSGLRKRISLDGMRGGSPFQVGGEFLFSQGRLIWCHRMKNVRDHAEMKTIRRVLDVSEDDHHSDMSSHNATSISDEGTASLTGSTDGDNATTQGIYNMSMADPDLEPSPISRRHLRNASDDFDSQLSQRPSGSTGGFQLIFDNNAGDTPRARLGRAHPSAELRELRALPLPKRGSGGRG